MCIRDRCVCVCVCVCSLAHARTMALPDILYPCYMSMVPVLQSVHLCSDYFIRLPVHLSVCPWSVCLLLIKLYGSLLLMSLCVSALPWGKSIHLCLFHLPEHLHRGTSQSETTLILNTMALKPKRSSLISCYSSSEKCLCGMCSAGLWLWSSLTVGGTEYRIQNLYCLWIT